jgi:phosphoglycolate phosphatase
MKLKLVIFDCDGTIVDSQHMIVGAMDLAFADAGLSPPPREAVLSVVGLSLPQAIERLLPDRDTRLVRRIAATYRSSFGQLRKIPEKREPLYPGIAEAIRELAGRPDIVLGIATGKSARGVAQLLAREGMQDVFVTIQTADTHPSKPHPSMILHALSEAGVEADSAVMIGDTTFDVEMARAAEVGAVGVSWGYHPVTALERAGAHAVAGTCDGLPAIVMRLLEQEGGRP